MLLVTLGLAACIGYVVGVTHGYYEGYDQGVNHCLNALDDAAKELKL
jgi:ABC-type dipeptide/oligopeptide/nickel transport system permease subunit